MSTYEISEQSDGAGVSSQAIHPDIFGALPMEFEAQQIAERRQFGVARNETISNSKLALKSGRRVLADMCIYEPDRTRNFHQVVEAGIDGYLRPKKGPLPHKLKGGWAEWLSTHSLNLRK